MLVLHTVGRESAVPRRRHQCVVGTCIGAGVHWNARGGGLITLLVVWVGAGVAAHGVRLAVSSCCLGWGTLSGAGTSAVYGEDTCQLEARAR